MRLAKRPTRNSRPRGVFITATDTGVGKTLVASALVTWLAQREINVGVMKPIETGVLRLTQAQSDGVRLKIAAGCHDRMADVSPYVFRLPVAPLSAARAAGTTVRIDTIMRAFRALHQKHTLMVVEGVGGVLVPITQTLNLVDLIYQMRLSTIVVGQSGLGGINHAMLTLAALRYRKIPILALVLTRCQPGRSKAERAQEQSTVSVLRRRAGIPVVGPLPYDASLKRNGNDGLVRLARTAPITKLARLVLAHMIHEGSSRQRADARRDGYSEARGLAPPSAAVPVPLLRRGQAPRRRVPVPNSMSKG